MNERTIVGDMSEQRYAQKVLLALATPATTPPPVAIDEDKSRNAAKCMIEYLCARLAKEGDVPKLLERTTYDWSEGLINFRNAVYNHLWTNLRPNLVHHFRELADTRPAVYVMAAWNPEGDLVHVWAIPEQVLFDAFPKHGVEQTEKRTIRVFPDVHIFERCPDSPDLSPFYRAFQWSKGELQKLVEAAKIDDAVRRRNRDEDAVEPDEPDDLTDKESSPGYSSATVEFVKELPDHVNDADWHDANKDRYCRVLRDPTRRLVEMLRTQYIERLSPEVAGAKRQISILKKNDYGKGGYHAHYWFAFYDPNAKSKTKSVQLFFGLLGIQKVWRYGFSMGNYCDEYVQRLQAAWSQSTEAMASYMIGAPEGTIVGLSRGDANERMSPNAFAGKLRSEAMNATHFHGLTRVDVIREFPLESLPEHDDTLVQDIGEFFAWAWPFVVASITGSWPLSSSDVPKKPQEPKNDEDVDEDAPDTLEALSSLTSLPLSFLDDLEQALLAKQQAVIVGPPGTSKTYIAQHFARFFVGQRPGRPQGSHDVLFMHANWTYEDFFEGIKPATNKDGTLIFAPRKGFFLEWIEGLKGYEAARHVLVLDEINRCDTAAVLGELLQLLEYRGKTVRLQSGRQFVFPRHAFIIGTMNSADRSIGRMDLALRRRFLWLNLYPQPDTLQRWLDRPGNNPIEFKAASLAECNDLLAKRGIPQEQHIGHALFMVQQSNPDDEVSVHDIPLTEKLLRRIVTFSVLPYVRELVTIQFGQNDDELVNLIQSTLLTCLAS